MADRVSCCLSQGVLTSEYADAVTSLAHTFRGELAHDKLQPAGTLFQLFLGPSPRVSLFRSCATGSVLLLRAAPALQLAEEQQRLAQSYTASGSGETGSSGPGHHGFDDRAEQEKVEGAYGHWQLLNQMLLSSSGNRTRSSRVAHFPQSLYYGPIARSVRLSTESTPPAIFVAFLFLSMAVQAYPVDHQQHIHVTGGAVLPKRVLKARIRQALGPFAQLMEGSTNTCSSATWDESLDAVVEAAHERRADFLPTLGL
eukprot:scaffold3032_cov375-Prasinococcus_capsulatus_cf.AAC.17